MPHPPTPPTLSPPPHLLTGPTQLAPKAWLPRHATEAGLRALLAHLHLLAEALCGGVQALLDQVCGWQRCRSPGVCVVGGVGGWGVGGGRVRQTGGRDGVLYSLQMHINRKIPFSLPIHLDFPLACAAASPPLLTPLQDATGALARRCLHRIVQPVGWGLATSTQCWHHRQLRNPLGDVSLPPLLALPPGPATLAMHSLAGQLLTATTLDGGSGGNGGVRRGRPVLGLLLLQGPHLLWSSLAPGDTAAVFALLAASLLHASASASASAQPASVGGGGSSSSGDSISGGAADAPDAAAAGCGASMSASALEGLWALEGSAWQQLPSGFLVKRCSSGGSGAEAVASNGGGEAAAAPVVTVPLVHLQQHGKRQQQLQNQHRPACQQGQQAQPVSLEEELSEAERTAGQQGDSATQLQLLPLLLPEGRGLLVALLLRRDVLLTPQMLAALHRLAAPPARQLAAQVRCWWSRRSSGNCCRWGRGGGGSRLASPSL